MITRIQTRSYRSLKGIDQSLREFQALVGPNASGKTTFLDVIAFFSDLMRNDGDVFETVHSRSPLFEQLLWKGEGKSFQLAIEADLPQDVTSRLNRTLKGNSRVRYAIEVAFSQRTNQITLDKETLWLKVPDEGTERKPSVEFPAKRPAPLLFRQGTEDTLIFERERRGKDRFVVEGRTHFSELKNGNRERIGRHIENNRSGLARIPGDEKRFPVGTYLQRYLEQDVYNVVLNSQIIRQPSPPGQGNIFRPDGSNLPWLVAELRRSRKQFQLWLAHVRTALEEIQDITTVERPEDRHRYLVIEYTSGVKAPSWLVSDGTLRLLALTILAYMPDLKGTFLIEEPENGIHPEALDTVMLSLSSMYDSQVLVATHSPVAVNTLELEDLLCFAKNSDGATDIVVGNRHPLLRDWRKGAPDLGVLFTAGILS